MNKLQDTFKTAEQAGEWIIEHSPDSPATVSEVSDELESVRKDVDEVGRELADLKEQYHLKVLDSKPFNVVLDDFANWLADVDRKITKEKKLSAAYPVVLKQSDKLQVMLKCVEVQVHQWAAGCVQFKGVRSRSIFQTSTRIYFLQVIKCELQQLKPIQEYIENKAEEQTSETEGDENIPKKLSQLKRYWTSVAEKIRNRENVISGLLPAAEKLNSTKEKFVAQKNTVEQKLHAIQPVAAEEAEVQKQCDTLQVSHTIFINCKVTSILLI